MIPALLFILGAGIVAVTLPEQPPTVEPGIPSGFMSKPVTVEEIDEIERMPASK